MAVTVATGGLEQGLDLVGSQMLPGPQLGVLLPLRSDCSFYFSWHDQLEMRFRHVKSMPPLMTVRSSMKYEQSARARARLLRRRFAGGFGVSASSTLTVHYRGAQRRRVPSPAMEIGEKRIDAMANTMSKSELIQRIVDGHPNEIARKDVKGVIDAVAAIGHKELKKTGAFVVPGLAKFIVIKKPATKARQGINPFTKEPTTFKAKPARKIVRARPVKAAKDAVA
jgi:DNA-binding protein HU-beta